MQSVLPSFSSSIKGVSSMHKRSDVPQTPPESSEVEYYKALAQLSENRAREIRRIAALERSKLEQRLLEQEPTIKAYAEEQERLRLERERLRENYERLKVSSERVKDNCQRLKMDLAATRVQLRELLKAQKTLSASRAHRLANAYVRLATERSLLARTLRLLRPVARALNRFRQALR
jgi:predicted ribosome quality control (RQC) complex YloA/Tae2 family protein